MDIYPPTHFEGGQDLPVLEINREYNDEEILVYSKELEEIILETETSTLGKTVYYQFGDLSKEKEKTIGKCFVYPNANLVVIDRNFFDANGDWNRRSLVWHEMGHCLLGRAHRALYYQGPNSSYDGGYKPAWPLVAHYLGDGSVNPDYRGDWPLSLMNNTIVKEAKFKVEYEYYLRELLQENF